MEDFIGYLVSGAILAGTALLSIVVKWVFDKLRASKLLKTGSTKSVLLDTIENLATKGIAIANQRLVDKLRTDGLWKVDDKTVYDANCANALDIATESVDQLLSVEECKQAKAIFGKDDYLNVIKNIIDVKIRESKTTQNNNQIEE